MANLISSHNFSFIFSLKLYPKKPKENVFNKIMRIKLDPLLMTGICFIWETTETHVKKNDLFSIL